MDSNLKDSIQKELNTIQAPESLFEFAYQVPDLVEDGGKPMKTKKKGFKKLIYGATAAVACSAMFTFGVNLSPSFASYMEKVPVLNQISEFVQGIDKVADKVTETVAYSAVDQNITFTVDQIIADAKRTVLLYHAMLDDKTMDVSSLKLENYTIFDENGNVIIKRQDGEWTKGEDTQFSPRWTLWPGELESDDPSKLLGMMELISQEGTASTPKQLKLSIDRFKVINHSGEEVKTIDGNWTIDIPLNADNISTKPIEYGEQAFSINAGEQQLDININFVKVYPTIAEMDIELVTEIAGGIFYDYHLEDEKGTIYKHVEDGILTDTGDALPQFESSYFNDTKELYLVMNKVTLIKRVNDDFEEEIFDVNKKVKLK